MEEGKLTKDAGAGKLEQTGGQAGQLELEFPPTENEKEQEAVIEAVLFTMGRSVELRQLAAAIGQNRDTAKRTVERLKARYDKSRSCGMQIIALEDSYQMCTKAKYYDNLIRVAATPKKQVLTEVMLETLSIIAYKQPVTKLEIEKIRGVKSDHAVNRLIEFNLVYEVGRMDAPGRPALFATTEEFLRRFGVGSTDDLPSMNPEQAEEIKAEVEEELQLKLEDLAVQSADGAEDELAAEAGAAGREQTAAERLPESPSEAAWRELTAGAETAHPQGESAAKEQTGGTDLPQSQGESAPKEQTTGDPHPRPEHASDHDSDDLDDEELALLEQEAAYAAELEAAAAAREAEEERERR
ncbi:MAG: SMC-Scp complex subunit ScpB [Clostridium sp.]|nr:SMC-Scp complex subunit ScpB [Clostridium sp.]